MGWSLIDAPLAPWHPFRSTLELLLVLSFLLGPGETCRTAPSPESQDFPGAIPPEEVAERLGPP